MTTSITPMPQPPAFWAQRRRHPNTLMPRSPPPLTSARWTSSSASDVGPQSPPELGDLGGRRLRPLHSDVHTIHVDDVEKHDAVVACVSPLNPPILGDLGALTRVLTTTFAKGNDVTKHQPSGRGGSRG